MNCRERVLTTLDHDEPDKVPYYEHVIQQPELASKLGFGQMGGEIDLKKTVSFLGNLRGLRNGVNKLGPIIANTPKIIKPLVGLFIKGYFKIFIKCKVDLCPFFYGPFSYFKFLKPNFLVSGFGQIFELKTVAGVPSGYYVGGYLNKENFDHFPKMNPAEPLGIVAMKKIRKKISDEQIFIVPGIFTGFFDATSMGFGFENFSQLLIKDQGFMKKVVREKELLYTEMVKHAIDELNLEAFFIGDDLAYNRAPFLSPRHFRQIFLPSYKRLSNVMHKRGCKFLFHTDGNIMPIIDQLLEFADFIHPWQVSAGIDIFDVKEKYGDKVTIAGNVPIPMLVHSSRKEIADYVKELMKKCAPGGGYMISSGNSIVPEIPWQNYLTMLSTFWKYRDYPINV